MRKPFKPRIGSLFSVFLLSVVSFFIYFFFFAVVFCLFQGISCIEKWLLEIVASNVNKFPRNVVALYEDSYSKKTIHHFLVLILYFG